MRQILWAIIGLILLPYPIFAGPHGQQIVDFSAIDGESVTLLAVASSQVPNPVRTFHLVSVTPDGAPVIIPVKRGYFTGDAQATVTPLAIATYLQATAILAVVDEEQSPLLKLVLAMVKPDGSLASVWVEEDGTRPPMLVFGGVSRELTNDIRKGALLLDGEGCLWALYQVDAKEWLLYKVEHGKLDTSFASKGLRALRTLPSTAMQLFQPLGSAAVTVITRTSQDLPSTAERHMTDVVGVNQDGSGETFFSGPFLTKAFRGEPMPFMIVEGGRSEPVLADASGSHFHFYFARESERPVGALNNKLVTIAGRKVRYYDYRSVVGGLAFLTRDEADTRIKYMFWNGDLRSPPSEVISAKLELPDPCLRAF